MRSPVAFSHFPALLGSESHINATVGLVRQTQALDRLSFLHLARPSSRVKTGSEHRCRYSLGDSNIQVSVVSCHRVVRMIYLGALLI